MQKKWCGHGRTASVAPSSGEFGHHISVILVSCEGQLIRSMLQVKDSPNHYP